MKFETWTFLVLGTFFIWNCVIMYRIDRLKDEDTRLRKDIDVSVESHEIWKHKLVDFYMDDLRDRVRNLERTTKDKIINRLCDWLIRQKTKVR